MSIWWFLWSSVCANVVVDNAVDNVNTYDVFIQLFDEERCHFQSENILLTTSNCYANRYERPTDGQSIGLAYSVVIVNFHNRTSLRGDGGKHPRSINIYYYSDACHTRIGEPLQLVEGECSGLQKRPIFHTLHGWFTLRQRTVGGLTKACTGGSHVCSTIRLLHNHVYRTPSCFGESTHALSYPVGPSLGKGDCLRYNNGTQYFSIDSNNADTVYEYDYPHSPDCTTNGVDCIDCVKEQRYQIQLGFCYVLLETNSFHWRVDPDPLTDADSSSIVGNDAQGLPTLGAVSFLLLAWIAWL